MNPGPRWIGMVKALSDRPVRVPATTNEGDGMSEMTYNESAKATRPSPLSDLDDAMETIEQTLELLRHKLDAVIPQTDTVMSDPHPRALPDTALRGRVERLNTIRERLAYITQGIDL